MCVTILFHQNIFSITVASYNKDCIVGNGDLWRFGVQYCNEKKSSKGGLLILVLFGDCDQCTMPKMQREFQCIIPIGVG